MLFIESEEILSLHLLNFLFKLLETLYNDFLGWIDVHIIRYYRYGHLRLSYTLLESENKQIKK